MRMPVTERHQYVYKKCNHLDDDCGVCEECLDGEIADAIADEREACAMVAEHGVYLGSTPSGDIYAASSGLAAAIRSRGDIK